MIYHAPLISPRSGILDGLMYYCCMPGCLGSVLEINEMPTFRPNAFFWEKYHKGGDGGEKQRWETYAETMREIMHENGKLSYSTPIETSANDKWKLEIEFGFLPKPKARIVSSDVTPTEVPAAAAEGNPKTESKLVPEIELAEIPPTEDKVDSAVKDGEIAEEEANDAHKVDLEH